MVWKKKPGKAGQGGQGAAASLRIKLTNPDAPAASLSGTSPAVLLPATAQPGTLRPYYLTHGTLHVRSVTRSQGASDANASNPNSRGGGAAATAAAPWEPWQQERLVVTAVLPPQEVHCTMQQAYVPQPWRPAPLQQHVRVVLPSPPPPPPGPAASAAAAAAARAASAGEAATAAAAGGGGTAAAEEAADIAQTQEPSGPAVACSAGALAAAVAPATEQCLAAGPLLGCAPRPTACLLPAAGHAWAAAAAAGRCAAGRHQGSTDTCSGSPLCRRRQLAPVSWLHAPPTAHHWAAAAGRDTRSDPLRRCEDATASWLHAPPTAHHWAAAAGRDTRSDPLRRCEDAPASWLHAPATAHHWAAAAGRDTRSDPLRRCEDAPASWLHAPATALHWAAAVGRDTRSGPLRRCEDAPC